MYVMHMMWVEEERAVCVCLCAQTAETIWPFDVAAVTNQIISSLSFVLAICRRFPETQVEMSSKKQTHNTPACCQCRSDDGGGGCLRLILHLQTLCYSSLLAKHIHIWWVCIRNSSLLLWCVWKGGSWGFPLMPDLPTRLCITDQQFSSSGWYYDLKLRLYEPESLLHLN